jgi:anti-anti-sigma factor
MLIDVAPLFEIEWAGKTVVLIPKADLSEFAFQQLDTEAREILEMLDQAANTSVVIDCANTDFFGSTALGFFMKLWLRVQRGNGHMAFCNVSVHAKEILRVTKTDSLWSVCRSRIEALRIVREAEAS